MSILSSSINLVVDDQSLPAALANTSPPLSPPRTVTALADALTGRLYVLSPRDRRPFSLRVAGLLFSRKPLATPSYVDTPFAGKVLSVALIESAGGQKHLSF